MIGERERNGERQTDRQTDRQSQTDDWYIDITFSTDIVTYRENYSFEGEHSTVHITGKHHRLEGREISIGFFV